MRTLNVKRLLLLCLPLLMAAAAGCGKRKAETPELPKEEVSFVPAETAQAAPPEEYSFVTQGDALSAVLPTLSPSPAPTPTAAPAPTPGPTAGPKITAAWYAERNETLAELIVLNGGAPDRAAADAIVARMEIDPDKPMIALTFDDGPTNGVTNVILDVLEKYNARATFFVVGSRVPGSEAILRRAVCLGCEIGSHTYNHDELAGLSEAEQRETVEKTSKAVFDACGYRIRSLRPPEGQNTASIKALAAAEDLALVYWSHSTHDYKLKSSRDVADYVQYDRQNKRAIRAGDIVLMHDLRKYTSEAMEEIVSTLVGQGYQLVTVQELLQLSDSGFLPGHSYKKQ